MPGRAVFNIRLAVPPGGARGRDAAGPRLVLAVLADARATRSALSGPFGDFHVQPSGREMVFVGGGVGMAPLRAMIHQQLGRAPTRRIRYFYGARTAADLFYVDEFDGLARRHRNFSWTPALSDPAPGDRWTGRDRLHPRHAARRDGGHPAPEECEYYLCGPPVMISAVLSTLERLGVEPASIFYDDFGL